MKQVIFNVGGALATYTEFDNKKLLIDIGKSADFNPITDFLLPLYKKRNDVSSKHNNKKYHIDQLIISHPHEDHMSSIIDFNNYFHPELLTCPNSNHGMDDGHELNWDLVGNEGKEFIKELKKMLEGRVPPLRMTSDQNEFLYYIPPTEVESSDDLSNESYVNNVSIAVFLIINNHRVFIPGDLQKLGMSKIIEKNYNLKSKLKGGVDVLIAPHHGLRSSFCTDMFDQMKDKKTRSINIVSEKPNNTKDNRNIDSRYSSSDFCLGINNLKGGNSIDKCYQVKTSRGHIFIDYSKKDYPCIEIINDTKTLIERFY